MSAVDVVVGVAILVFAALVAHDFERTIGNNLIGIHVDRCACAALHHVDGEVFVQLSVDNLLASLTDGTCDFVVNHAEGVVGLHGSELHISNSDDVIGIIAHLFSRNVIVVNAALCLHAIVGIGRHFELT